MNRHWNRQGIHRRRLGFEGLERRELLTGNVTAGLDVNGNLTITGDLQDNHVAIFPGQFGTILVAGGRSNGQASGNTTVNGQTGPVAFNTTGGLVANMGDGHDRILMTRLALQGNIIANMGRGADQFALQSMLRERLALRSIQAGP